MILIGLTGGIGSGKSTVASLLEAHGAVIIDADRITRELQEPGNEVFSSMVDYFGPRILTEAGEIDRAAVAAHVFNDPTELAALNAIVHPAVGAEMARRLDELRGTPAIVVLDVPLLVESQRDDLAALIVVDAEPEIAIDRLVTQRNMTEDDARARMRHQASREERLAKADLVIHNHGSLDDLITQVDAAVDWVTSNLIQN